MKKWHLPPKPLIGMLLVSSLAAAQSAMVVLTYLGQAIELQNADATVFYSNRFSADGTKKFHQQVSPDPSGVIGGSGWPHGPNLNDGTPLSAGDAPFTQLEEAGTDTDNPCGVMIPAYTRCVDSPVGSPRAGRLVEYSAQNVEGYHYLVTAQDGLAGERYHFGFQRVPVQPLLDSLGWSRINLFQVQALRDRRPPFVLGELDQDYFIDLNGTNLTLEDSLALIGEKTGCSIILKYNTVVIESCGN